MKERPSCVPEPAKKTGKGRSSTFYLRPRFYHLLPEEDRPEGWEEAAQDDEVRWQQECVAAKAKAEKKQAKKVVAKAEDLDGDESDGDSTMNSKSTMTSLTGNDSDLDSEQPKKKMKMGF